MLAHHLEGNEHGYASVILCVLTIAGLSNAYAIALYVLLKPVWRFAGGDAATLRKSFAIMQIGEFTAFIACAIAMLVFVAQKDDVQFSIAIAVSLELMFPIRALVLKNNKLTFCVTKI